MGGEGRCEVSILAPLIPTPYVLIDYSYRIVLDLAQNQHAGLIGIAVVVNLLLLLFVDQNPGNDACPGIPRWRCGRPKSERR